MKGYRDPTHFRVKAFRLGLLRVGCTLVVSGFANASYASLTPTVFVDTETDLAIIWDWDEFSGRGEHGDGLAKDDTNIPDLTYWEVTLTTTLAELSTLTWTVQIQVRHLADPHEGDVGGGGLAVLAKNVCEKASLCRYVWV